MMRKKENHDKGIWRKKDRTQSQIMVTLQSQNVFYKSFSLPDVPQSSKTYQNLRKILNFYIPEKNIGKKIFFVT